MNNGTIIIAGNFFFPDGNAAGKYNLPYGLMLRELGYNVVLIGTSETVDYSSSIVGTLKEEYGLKSYSMPYPKRRLDWLKYRTQLSNVHQIISLQENIKGIIVFGSPALSLWLRGLYHWSRRTKVAFIAHCAEGVRVTKRGLVYSTIRAIDEVYHKRILLPRADGVIVGGPLLFQYFRSRRCNAVVFPTLVDTRRFKDQVEEFLGGDMYTTRDRKRRFIYVGIPFDKNSLSVPRADFKDRLDKTIELFHKVYPLESNFTFDIYGVTQDEYLFRVPEHTSVLAELADRVAFHGKIGFDEAVKEIIASDFYIFHRDKTPITQSAFPTKASEPISLGVPLITNDTSYIFNYVIDGVTGFKIDDKNEVMTVVNLIRQSTGQLLHLRKRCINDKVFDYRNSIPRFEAFLSSLLGDATS